MLTVAAIAVLAVGVAIAVERPSGTAGTRGHGDAAERLTDSQLVGQRIVDLERRIRRGRIAGVVLFSDNVGSRAGVRRLVRRLQSIPRPSGLDQPLLVMVDQEGGLVKRLPGPPTLSAARMGAAACASRDRSAAPRSRC
jgi:beta-N-acetylhexosaminidase